MPAAAGAHVGPLACRLHCAHWTPSWKCIQVNYNYNYSPCICCFQPAGLPNNFASFMLAAPPGALGSARRVFLSLCWWRMIPRQLYRVLSRCASQSRARSIVCYRDSGSCTPRTGSGSDLAGHSGAFAAWACSAMPAWRRKHSASVTRHYEQICKAEIHFGGLNSGFLMPEGQQIRKSTTRDQK